MPAVLTTRWWDSQLEPPAKHRDWYDRTFGFVWGAGGSQLDYVLKGGDFVGEFAAESVATGQTPFVTIRLNDGQMCSHPPVYVHFDLSSDPPPTHTHTHTHSLSLSLSLCPSCCRVSQTGRSVWPLSLSVLKGLWRGGREVGVCRWSWGCAVVWPVVETVCVAPPELPYGRRWARQRLSAGPL